MTSIRQWLLNISRGALLGEWNGTRRSIRGSGNLFRAEGASFSNLALDIIGDNNVIVIGEGSRLNNVTFHVRGNGHQIEFGPNCRVSRSGNFWFEDEGGSLQVGNNTTMVDVHIAVTEQNSRVTIGEDCMLANDIDIRTGDSHSVIDSQTGERLNYAADVVINRHVWVAPHVVILKGVTIGENSIIATGAVVTKSCEPGVILGGNPAVVIRTGVSWKRERLQK
jgi:acetyltransferase-like isoleucine patch superfamily enzyme